MRLVDELASDRRSRTMLLVLILFVTVVVRLASLGAYALNSNGRIRLIEVETRRDGPTLDARGVPDSPAAARGR